MQKKEIKNVVGLSLSNFRMRKDFSSYKTTEEKNNRAKNLKKKNINNCAVRKVKIPIS